MNCTDVIFGKRKVGVALAELLSPFSIARLLYFDARGLEPADEVRLCAQRVDLAALMARNDLVLLLPLTGSTRHLVENDALTPTRPGTYLVNVGRGSVVDERAVLHALHTGQLPDTQPMSSRWWTVHCRGDPSRSRRRYGATLTRVFTPPLGSAVDSIRRDMSLTAARLARQALAGR